MDRESITYGEGPNPEVWFPWNLPARPALTDQIIRYSYLDAEGDHVWSNQLMGQHIPDSLIDDKKLMFANSKRRTFWIGVSIDDADTLKLMSELTGKPVDPAQIARVRAKSKVEGNKLTPNPPRIGEETPSFHDEVVKLTPVTDPVERAKGDYKAKRNAIKELVRNAALTGARRISWKMYDAPDNIPYAQAFSKAMTDDEFDGFGVHVHVADNEVPGVTVELEW